ncbi:ferric reductase-like transmembrane domain-containing protein [archaeon]|nr:ferric reductase-like transmembrane domain-containing protein [archaeon]
MRRNILIGNIVTYVATFLPVIILLVENPSVLKLDNFYNTCTTLAKIGGLAGIGLFALNVLLSSRNKYLDRIYGGLDNVYKVHHDKGLITFILLLMHPSFLALRELETSIMAMILFFLPSSSIPINIGKLALILFSVAIIFTVLRRFEYQKLQKIHKSLGIVFMIGTVHAFTVGSNVSTQPVLRLYVSVLVLVAGVSYVNTTLLGNIVSKKYRYTVETIESSGEVIKIDMKPIDERIPYTSGQFIFPSFQHEELKETHPFSMTSKPSDSRLSLAIRPLGDYTRRLSGLSFGTEVTIDGPYGGFNYRKGGNKQVWIAGGIGITPYLSMIKALSDESSRPAIDMYFSYRNDGDKELGKELKDRLSEWDNCNYYAFDTRSVSRLSVEEISETSQDLLDSDIFICGPMAMIEDLEKQFIKKGVKRENIHLERFKLL